MELERLGLPTLLVSILSHDNPSSDFGQLECFQGCSISLEERSERLRLIMSTKALSAVGLSIFNFTRTHSSLATFR